MCSKEVSLYYYIEAIFLFIKTKNLLIRGFMSILGPYKNSVLKRNFK